MSLYGILSDYSERVSITERHTSYDHKYIFKQAFAFAKKTLLTYFKDLLLHISI